MKKFYHLAGDEFLETSGVARTKGDGCSVLRNKSVGPYICWFWFGFFSLHVPSLAYVL